MWSCRCCYRPSWLWCSSNCQLLRIVIQSQLVSVPELWWPMRKRSENSCKSRFCLHQRYKILLMVIHRIYWQSRIVSAFHTAFFTNQKTLHRDCPPQHRLEISEPQSFGIFKSSLWSALQKSVFNVTLVHLMMTSGVKWSEVMRFITFTPYLFLFINRNSCSSAINRSKISDKNIYGGETYLQCCSTSSLEYALMALFYSYQNAVIFV